ncbi:cullin-5 [Caerostris extrusa]|uniref:Cullin-5 n=1 Tax=Caerostris extrusa TaxID=172846 RepID=A0AAV4XVP7_CAEEX|nr:cullin-5 [Caerostris extrusa]
MKNLVAVFFLVANILIIKNLLTQPRISGLPSFDRYWPVIEPLFLKLLHQEAVDKAKWQDLFLLAHQICLCDLKGCTKLHSNLQKIIESFLRQVMSNVFTDQEDQALLKAYTAEWRKFVTQCTYLPVPFSEIEIALGLKAAYDDKKQNKEIRIFGW